MGGFTWSIEAGSLPTGLGLNAATREISGTPTVIETQYVMVGVKSDDRQRAIQALWIQVHP